MSSTTLHNYTVQFHNSEEYHSLKQEIFTQDGYYFETENPAPRIIDAGAHIGLATLYFKYLYPNAHITCIEPLPENLELLRENISFNRLENIEIEPVALGTTVGELTLHTDVTKAQWHSTSGMLPGAWNGQQKSRSLTVATKPLSAFLTEPIDLLKMDIEGMESMVLREASSQLKFVKHLLLEFHPHRGHTLENFVEFLEKHFPNVEVTQDGSEVKRLHKSTGLVLITAWR